MPDWIYWGDKWHGLSFEIMGPLFSLVAGYSYITSTGARSRLQLLTAERLTGVALSLSLVCLYLMNLRTLGVRSDASHKDSGFTEEAYNYYLIGSVINICTMVVTLNQIFKRRLDLKSEVEAQGDLERKWNTMRGESSNSQAGPASTTDRESYSDRKRRLERESAQNQPKNLVAAAEEHTFEAGDESEEEDELGESQVML